MPQPSEGQEKARFDAFLDPEKKQRYERAKELGGFRSLTAFVFNAVDKEADRIIEEHEKFFASERDKEIFFEAFLNPPQPNEAAMKAAKRYKELTRRE